MKKQLYRAFQWFMYGSGVFVLRTMALLIRPWTKIVFWDENQGRTKPPQWSPLLVTSKHSSMLDIPLTGIFVHRWGHFMARDNLFEVPIFGKWMRWVGAFSVKRGAPDKVAIRTATGYLDRNEAVVISPEGTRKGDPNVINKLEEGVAFIALRAKRLPWILPVAIFYVHGSRKWLPRGIVIVFWLYIKPEDIPNDRDELLILIKSRMSSALEKAKWLAGIDFPSY